MKNINNIKRLEEWICKNPKEWHKICRTKGEIITFEEYKRLAELLEKDNLSEIIFVLATCHYYVIEPKVDLIMNKLVEILEYEK